MTQTYRLELGRDELGQMLDGLAIRAESWERTAEYLRTGEMSADDLFIVEECRDAEEARGIAAQYRAILQKIREQMANGANAGSPFSGSDA